MQIETLKFEDPSKNSGFKSLEDLFAPPKVEVEIIHVPVPDRERDPYYYSYQSSHANIGGALRALDVLTQKVVPAYMVVKGHLALDLRLDGRCPERVLIEASSKDPRPLAVFRLLAGLDHDINNVTTRFNEGTSPEYIEDWARTAGRMMADIGLPVKIDPVGVRQLRLSSASTTTTIMYELAGNAGWFDKAAKEKQPMPMPTVDQVIQKWKTDALPPVY